MDENKKPIPEDYGWHNQDGFDDLPSGWMYPEGEDAYFKALKIWETNNEKNLNNQ